MMVLATSAWGGGRALEQLLRCAGLDCVNEHQLTDNPEEADLILFAETVHFDDPEWRTLRQHPYLERFREKCFIYNEADTPWCVLPGLYCSMPRRAFQPRRQKAFSYLYTMNEMVAGPCDGPRPWLYSFMGASNHAARRRILKLRDKRAVLEDTSQYNQWRPTDLAEKERRQRRYVEVLSGSKFVLCPRGAGTSSYRLFETMKMGVAPVVISDEWVAPDGPDWSAFLLRVCEDEVANLPGLLRGHEHEAETRGLLARAAYERYFAPEVLFHHAVEACRELLELAAAAGSGDSVPALDRARPVYTSPLGARG
ncbi:MAG: exostosin family protein [Archangiaceae bacterium]|nr:exostosin family protein [Archangiaceae bacterium]